MSEPTGHHIILNGQSVGLPDSQRIGKTLDALVRQTGLHPICKPVIYVNGNSWSGFVMIAESHIALHGSEQRAWVDVFSCRLIDANAVLRILDSQLGGSWELTEMRRP